MAGIRSYGIYIPYYRLKREEIGRAYEKRTKGGEKAVAAFDEDSFTMALAAVMNCRADSTTKKTDAVFFASVTAPNAEKQVAAQIASALDIEGELRTSDFAGSMRAGTSAMLSAFDMARDGKTTLVTMADTRLGAPNGQYEDTFGDYAAAFEIGPEAEVANLVSSYSVSHDFHGIYREQGDLYPHTFDSAWVRDYGYTAFISEAVAGLLQKTGKKPEDITRVVIDAPDVRSGNAALKRCGFAPEQAQPELISEFGYAGTAYAPTLLAAALEESLPGDMVLYVSYSEGADALLFEVLKTSSCGGGEGIAHFREAKDNSIHYERYLRWKKLIDQEPPRRPAALRNSLIDLYRNRKKNLALHGCRCKACSTPFYPPQRICVNCGAIDEMEDYCFQGKAPKLATFAMDYTVASDDKPAILAVIDFEGGGRMFTQMVECRQEELRVGLPVKMAYRKLYTADHIMVYSWKCIPAVHENKEAQYDKRV